MKSMIDAALSYAARGWRVFPCSPGTKIPFKDTNGVKDATTDEEQIREWWTRWPKANIALACGPGSGVYVVDVDHDPEAGENGWEDLKTFPDLPKTVSQDTPRGGAHFLFKSSNPPSNKNKFRKGIDIRADGYYIMLSPSIHPNGKAYAWAPGLGPDEVELAEFPDFMRPVRKISPPWIRQKPEEAPKQAAPRPPVPVGATPITARARLYLAECEPAIQGMDGHSKLLWAARAMVVGFEMGEAEAISLLWADFNPRCVPPWDSGSPSERRDFERKVSEASKTPGHKPRGWLLDEYGLRGDTKAAALGGKLANELLAGQRDQGGEGPQPRRLPIESIADFLATPPPPLDCIVEELFEAGEKGEIIAPSKARKSFFAIDLVAHIAAGRDYLCFKIPRPRRVLLINLEIGRDWMKRRFFSRLAAYAIRPEEIRETLHIVNARSKGQDVREQAVEAVRRARAEVAIIDPRYKLLLPTESENAGEGVAGVLDLQDQIAEAGAASIFVGHDSKGTAGDKDDRDRGAGSGWTGRDCDFRIVLSPHADDPQDAVVLSIMRRNFPPFADVTIRHDGDSFQLDEGTAPRKETSFTRKQTAKTAQPMDTLRPVVLDILRKEGKTLPSGILLTRVREAAHIGEKRAISLIALCEEAGEIQSTPRQAKRGGEVRRGTPAQVEAYMKPLLPFEAKP